MSKLGEMRKCARCKANFMALPYEDTCRVCRREVRDSGGREAKPAPKKKPAAVIGPPALDPEIAALYRESIDLLRDDPRPEAVAVVARMRSYLGENAQTGTHKSGTHKGTHSGTHKPKRIEVAKDALTKADKQREYRARKGAEAKAANRERMRQKRAKP